MISNEKYITYNIYLYLNLFIIIYLQNIFGRLILEKIYSKEIQKLICYLKFIY